MPRRHFLSASSRAALFHIPSDIFSLERFYVLPEEASSQGDQKRKVFPSDDSAMKVVYLAAIRRGTVANGQWPELPWAKI